MALGRSAFWQIARLRSACIVAGLSQADTLAVTAAVESDRYDYDLTSSEWDARVKRVAERIRNGERPRIESGVFLGFLAAGAR